MRCAEGREGSGKRLTCGRWAWQRGGRQEQETEREGERAQGEELNKLTELEDLQELKELIELIELVSW